jgi:hypothetical protein
MKGKSQAVFSIMNLHTLKTDKQGIGIDQPILFA